MHFALRFTLAAGLTALALPALAQETAISTTRLPVKDGHFEFEGPFGTYNRGALQRGFQVYKEVCAACHGLDHIAFHNLDEAGGPGFTEPQAKAIAAGFKIPADPNDKGEINA
jgi:ubiquinol-cytochrome c reductase cytochrome c1 subunit